MSFTSLLLYLCVCVASWFFCLLAFPPLRIIKPSALGGVFVCVCVSGKMALGNNFSFTVLAFALGTFPLRLGLVRTGPFRNRYFQLTFFSSHAGNVVLFCLPFFPVPPVGTVWKRTKASGTQSRFVPCFFHIKRFVFLLVLYFYFFLHKHLVDLFSLFVVDVEEKTYLRACLFKYSSSDG